MTPSSAEGSLGRIARVCSNVAPNPLRRRRSKRLRPRTPFGAGLVRAPRSLTWAAAPISGGRRLAPAALASLCALAFTAAPALAAAPTVHSESTSPTAKPSEELRLEATVNAGEEAAGITTECHFEYGKTSVTEHSEVCEQGNALEGGEQGVAVTVKALQAGTTYDYRVVLKNVSGKIEGGEEKVTTLPVPATEVSSPSGATTATFKGTLTPLNSTVPAEYFFVYNVGEEFVCTGERRTEPTESAGIGSGVANVSTAVTGLEPNQKYTVCLVSTNTLGDSEEDLTPKYFETPPAPPTIVSQSASHHNNAGEPLNPGEARLEGVVNPNNQLTECHFQYGETSVTEHEVACEPEVLKGYGEQNVAAIVGGLQPGNTYHYQIIAKNGKGEVATIVEETVIPEEAPALPTAPEPATTALTAISATLHGVLNPLHEHEAQPGSYEFVYRQSATECQRTNPNTGQPENEKATPSTAANGHLGEKVEAELSGLLPGATYTFCLLARDNAEEAAVSPPATFTTPAVPLEITGTSATEVTATAAKLNAQVNPGGAETTYHFEYIDQAGYEAALAEGAANPYAKGVSTPESPSIGADNSLHPARATISGLQPGTTYHYRIVATNSQSPAGGTPGPDQTFTTETTGGEFALPDGRAYELVSPPQKDGAEVLGIGGGGITTAAGDATEASEDGTSVTYIASAPVGASPLGNVGSTQMFSTRGAGGWSSLDIATPHKHNAGGISLNGGEEYLRFSSDLSHAILVPLYSPLEPPLAPEIHQEVGGETEIYLRNNVTNTFRAVVTSEPLPEVSFEGATPDLSHVVFGGRSSFGNVHPGGTVGLDPNYPNAEGLYEWADGQTRLVSVLPNEKPASGLTTLGRNSAYSFDTSVGATRHAISDDGTRVVWSGEGGLFTRNMVTGETLQVDAVQSGGGAAGGGAFKVANSDGSRVFFTDGNALVTDAHQEGYIEGIFHGGDVYMFEPARPEGERLTDLTLGVAGADLGVNVLEANEAGTSIYVRTPGVLTSAPNSEGETATPCTETERGFPSRESVLSACNLYLLRESSAGSGSWSVTFVAGGAGGGESETLSDAEPLQRQAARVSPSGRYVAFMSRRSLTGYDNRDAISGEPDEEVYWYDAETNRLVCASCDPTGARPVGQYDTEVPPFVAMDPPRVWEGRWVAAVIPGWTEDGARRSTGHQPRYLDDSGRLFFTSSDALVPRDVNGREDVYEYEPAGVGSCQPPSYGQGASVVFNKTLGGCIGLISAGTGNTDSVFFDASASGSDVFFTTQDGLVSQDKDGTADMYDARVCTQTAPCPSSLAVSPACTTTDSCRLAPSPQPGIFSASGSATFAGAGNATPTPSAKKKTAKKKTVKCARGKKRSHGRCVKAKKKRPKAKKARNDRRPGR
jgi:hypothetical protein